MAVGVTVGTGVAVAVAVGSGVRVGSAVGSGVSVGAGYSGSALCSGSGVAASGTGVAAFCSGRAVSSPEAVPGSSSSSSTLSGASGRRSTSAYTGRAIAITRQAVISSAVSRRAQPVVLFPVLFNLLTRLSRWLDGSTLFHRGSLWNSKRSQLLLLIALSSDYTMCSKPLCNLFRIFFLAAVAFIHSDRAFYDPLRAQSATVPQNSPFLLHFSVFAQFLFRMRLFAAGLSG